MAAFILEKAFEALYAGVEDLIEKNIIFESLFIDVKSRLDEMEPLIREMAQYNEKMDRPKKEMEALKGVLTKGQEIVDDCAKDRLWNPFKKYKYARKLLEWDESLKRPLEMLHIQEARDIKKIEDRVEDIHRVIVKQQSGGEGSITNTRLELPPLPRLVVGLDAPLTDLKEKLLYDDRESILVLTAPGGCGKSGKLLSPQCFVRMKRSKVGLFKKNIFFVTVSQNGNVDLVVKQLSECMGSRAPTFQNDVHRSQWIQTFFNKREDPFLLVLDDIWSGSDLILESFQSEKSNYKILVTSRSEFPRFSSSYKLQLLDDGNAMKLFYHSASLGIEYSGYLEALSRKIIKRCNGFPLAITVVGRSLSGQPIEVWRKRESEWSNGASILDSETKLFLCLQSSLDALDKEFKLVQDCYLDLGAFPEDTKIRVDVLIDMWTELYDLDDDSVLTNIYALGNRNLATLVDERSRKMEGEDFYSNRFVTQHDLLRELATYNAKLARLEQRERVFIEMLSEKNIPKWWRREQIYRPKKARLLSLTSDRGDSGERRRALSVINNWEYDRDRDNWPNMQLPEVVVLVFNVIKSDGYTALPKFVEKLQKLKVAVIQTDPYSMLANFELLSSLRNLKRINLSGIGEFLTIKMGVRFTSVRKLSLYKCKISCLDPFDNMSHGFFHRKENMSYAFPNLKEMNIDNCHYFGETPAAFYSLVQLKVLTINDSGLGVTLPEEIGNLVNLEVLRVRNCSALQKIPSSIKKLRKLNFLDTSGCYIESLPDFIGELKSLRKLDMRHCQYLSALPPSVSDLHRLEEVICDEYNADQWRTVLPKLKNLRIVPR